LATSKATSKAKAGTKRAGAKIRSVAKRVKQAIAKVTKRRPKTKSAAAKPAPKPKRAPKRLGHRPAAPLPKTAVAAPHPAKRTGPVREGELAPGFALLDDTSQIFSSHVLAGEPYVLYFYPKDDTPGCTQEACDFRDRMADFSRTGLRVFGVSPDSPDRHGRFKDKYDLPFKLLSDEDQQLAKAYGVWVKKQNYGREYMGVERSTFLIGRDGRIQRIWRGVKVPGHVDAVLTQARQI
jgi:thioredoxin-dependent peroxiredoxin